ncbi:MAG: hypothetical protein KGL39_18855 [Patescibacteria group bacterium]|nr:hypothetical protein [Patescibacteria group bacterium]
MSVRADDVLNDPLGLHDVEVKGLTPCADLSTVLKQGAELGKLIGKKGADGPAAGPPTLQIRAVSAPRAAETKTSGAKASLSVAVDQRSARIETLSSVGDAHLRRSATGAKAAPQETKAASSGAEARVTPSGKAGKLVLKLKPQPATPPPDTSAVVHETLCAQCGKAMQHAEFEFRCADCGIVVPGDTVADDGDGVVMVGRLRLVGPGAGRLQPDLDRSSSGDAAAQQRGILDELKRLRDRYVEVGGRAFPLNILNKAAEYYHTIQQKLTKRSDNKKAILASCLYAASLRHNFSPGKHECAEMMQLPNRGTARGSNFVRRLKDEGIVTDIPVDEDPCWANVVTAFTLLKLEGEAFDWLRRAALDVVQTSIELKIENKTSQPKTKAMGATYVVLRRYIRRKDAAAEADIRMTAFCKMCGIRKTTIEGYIDTLNGYHSKLKAVYEKHGLFAGTIAVE